MPGRFVGILWIILSAWSPYADAQSLERWKAYYVNFGLPFEGSMGMTSATGTAQITITARSINGTVKFDGFDDDAPPDKLSLNRSGPTSHSGTISNEYPEPLPPLRLMGRYQRLNGWPTAPYSSPLAGRTCFVDEIILEFQRTFTRAFYYFAKPCRPE